MQAIGATGEGKVLLTAAGLSTKDREPTRQGVVIAKDADVSGVAGKFIRAVAQHRFWERERKE